MVYKHAHECEDKQVSDFDYLPDFYSSSSTSCGREAEERVKAWNTKFF